MANVKGIEYYPFNVDFFDDDKIALIESEFGVKGSIIAIRLLCKIYRSGYYYQWGDDECLLFSRKAGADIVPNTVQEVVNGLVRRSFFDKGVYDKFGILTSRGIQQRYFEAVKRRQKVEVCSDYLLVDVSKCNNIFFVERDAAQQKRTVKPKEERPAVHPQTEEDAIASEVQKLLSSQEWMESVAMRFKLTIQQVEEHLADFAIDCRSRGTEKHDSIQEAKRHFNDWLRIQLREQENGTANKEKSDKRRPSKGVTSRTEDFSTTF
ncbi:MAG: DUF4373 domain-containing protein [Bacteroidaceae bacterium]|nr:DUF4373 domain-containing protein [Bacteroidaceae bacterium]